MKTASLLCLLASLASAQSPYQPPKVTVRGVVLDTVTKKPIPGALIDLDRNPPALQSYRIGTKVTQMPPDTRGQEITTGPDGTFVFPDLDWGSHALAVTKAGYITATDTRPEYSYYGIQADPKMTPLRLFLSPAAEIAGRIATKDGKPQPNTPVTLYQQRFTDGHPGWQQTQEVFTGNDGRYSLTGLTNGSYLVRTGWVFDDAPELSHGTGCSGWNGFVPQAGFRPMLSPGVPDLASAKQIVLPSGGHAVADVAIVHEPFHPVTLRADRELAGGGTYTFFDRNGSVIEMARVPGSQCLFFAPLYPGVAARVNLPDGDYTAAIRSAYAKDDPYVQKQAAQPIYLDGTGKFTVAGGPVTAPPIPLHIEGLDKVGVDRGGLTTQVRVIRDSSPGTDLNSCNRQGVMGGIAGMARMPGTAGPLPEFTVRNIQLIRADGLPYDETFVGGTITGAPDAMQFRNMEPGQYWVHFIDIDRGYVASVTSGARDLSNEPLLVGPNGIAPPIEVTLRTDFGAIHGTNPIPKPYHDVIGLRSTFYALLIPQFAGFTGPRTYMLSSGSPGDFVACSLAPGRYKLYFVHGEKWVALESPESIMKQLGAGQDVLIKPGQTSEIKVVEPPVE